MGCLTLETTENHAVGKIIDWSRICILDRQSLVGRVLTGKTLLLMHVFPMKILLGKENLSEKVIFLKTIPTNFISQK